jgi:hypothetical protein
MLLPTVRAARAPGQADGGLRLGRSRTRAGSPRPFICPARARPETCAGRQRLPLSTSSSHELSPSSRAIPPRILLVPSHSCLSERACLSSAGRRPHSRSSRLRLAVRGRRRRRQLPSLRQATTVRAHPRRRRRRASTTVVSQPTAFSPTRRTWTQPSSRRSSRSSPRRAGARGGGTRSSPAKAGIGFTMCVCPPPFPRARLALDCGLTAGRWRMGQRALRRQFGMLGGPR